MRDQYAGDVTDMIKFALLRAIVPAEQRLGIAWYYAPGDDGRPDGRHTEYLRDAAWGELDAVVHAGLMGLRARSIEALQALPIHPPSTLFHSTALPRDSRKSWRAEMVAALAPADLVFLDPDNGVGNDPEKHAQPEELELLRRNGRSLVTIWFPARRGHLLQIQEMHQKLAGLGSRRTLTLRTSVSLPRGSETRLRLPPRVRNFSIIDGTDDLATRVSTFAARLATIPYVKASFHEAPLVEQLAK